jgi:hypothetical protein
MSDRKGRNPHTGAVLAAVSVLSAAVGMAPAVGAEQNAQGVQTSTQHKVDSNQLKYESNQHKCESTQLKYDSVQHKCVSNQLKLDSIQHKTSMQLKHADEATQLNPQPEPPTPKGGTPH